MAESTKVLSLLLQVGLLQVQILVAARKGENVWSKGKPPAPNREGAENSGGKTAGLLPATGKHR